MSSIDRVSQHNRKQLPYLRKVGLQLSAGWAGLTARLRRQDRLRILIHLIAWLWMALLVWDYASGNLTVNPIQAATQRTGKTALVFLILSLSCTPLNTLFGWRQVLRVRRTLGLYAFWFAAIHLSIFIGLDYGFDINLLWMELTQKRFVLVGAGAFLILLALAVTSYKYWMKRLGKNWKKLHRLVYGAGGLVVLHYAWAKKGDLFSLQGDILQPFLFGVLLVFLLVVRLPVVRATIQHWRTSLVRKSRSLRST